METTLIGVCGTLAGTLIGSVLTWLLSRDATAKERQHQETELIRQRREATAAALRDELGKIANAMPLESLKGSEAIQPLEASQRMVYAAWNRASLLRDPSIDRCYESLNTGLTLATLDAEEVGPTKNVNPWALTFAVEDLQECLDAYLLREPAPEPFFPDRKELGELVGSDPVGLPALHVEMRKRWLGRQVRGAREESEQERSDRLAEGETQ